MDRVYIPDGQGIYTPTTGYICPDLPDPPFRTPTQTNFLQSIPIN